MKTARRLHGVHTAIMAMLRSFDGVLVGDCLRSDCASMTFFALSLRIYGAHTTLSRRSHCAEIVKLRESAVHTQFKRGTDVTQSPYKCAPSVGVICDATTMLRRCCGDVCDFTALTSAFWIFFGRRENAVLVWQGFKLEHTMTRCQYMYKSV
jgi:hypothetical protein